MAHALAVSEFQNVLRQFKFKFKFKYFNFDAAATMLKGNTIQH